MNRILFLSLLLAASSQGSLAAARLLEIPSLQRKSDAMRLIVASHSILIRAAGQTTGAIVTALNQ
jgi:hypothetical protein